MYRMDRLSLLLCFVGIYFNSFATAGDVDYSGNQIWRVTPHSQEQVQVVREIGEMLQLDFWTDPVGPGIPVDVRVEPNQVGNLGKHFQLRGISDYKIHISDIQSLINNEKSFSRSGRSSARATDIASFDYSIYHPPEEIEEWMNFVVSEYNFVTKEQFGVSYEGRPIYVLKFEKPSANPKPTIYVDSLIHSREWVTAASLMFIFKEMLQNPKYTHMLDEVNWHYVPIVNVDGYHKTWNGDRMWRKTRSTGANSLCTGVDANRNFDNHWSYPGASGNPCSFAYYGPAAASESEVRHIQNYIMGFGKGKFDALVSVHSYSQMILYPYGWTYDLHSHSDELNATSKLMHDAIKAVHGKNYVYGPSAVTIYVTSADTTDWAFDEMGIVQSYTYELRDEGQYGFLLPADQIIPNGEEFRDGLEALSNYVRDSYKTS